MSWSYSCPGAKDKGVYGFERNGAMAGSRNPPLPDDDERPVADALPSPLPELSWPATWYMYAHNETMMHAQIKAGVILKENSAADIKAVMMSAD